jgi:hypothetical protein
MMCAGVLNGCGELASLPQPQDWTASFIPFCGRNVHCPASFQRCVFGRDRGGKWWPGGEKGFMSYAEDNGAVIPYVGCYQALRNERLQLRAHWCWQVSLIKQPSDGAALFIDCDELEQPGEHLITRATVFRQRLGHGLVSLFDQRTANAAELVIALHRQLTAATDTFSQLLQCERQKGQRLTGASVVYQSVYQLMIHVNVSKPGRAFDHRSQRFAAQWPKWECAGREFFQFRAGQKLPEEFRTKRADYPYRSGQPRTQQAGKLGSAPRGGQSE